MNEYFQSISKTKHHKLKESPEAVPRTRVNQPMDSYFTGDKLPCSWKMMAILV